MHPGPLSIRSARGAGPDAAGFSPRSQATSAYDDGAGQEDSPGQASSRCREEARGRTASGQARAVAVRWLGHA
eukprot:9809494-Alexandrium_andersonii.AAC.1